MLQAVMRRATAALLLLGGIACLQAFARDLPPTRNQFYGAIAYHHASGSMGWATDRRTSREARTEALKLCRHEKCEIVATVTRGCVALAKDVKKFVIQRGATRQEAETKALRRCGERCEIAAWTCTR